MTDKEKQIEALLEKEIIYCKEDCLVCARKNTVFKRVLAILKQ